MDYKIGRQLHHHSDEKHRRRLENQSGCKEDDKRNR